MFNPNYLVYFDVGFTEYLRAIGQPYPQAFEAAGTDTFAVAASIAFHAPAMMDDVLRVLVRTKTLGRTSMEIAFGIRRSETLIADGFTTYVNADRRTREPSPLPDSLRDAITQYESTQPLPKSSQARKDL